jgi:hypothetical protein
MKRNYRKLRSNISQEFITYLSGILDQSASFYIKKQPINTGQEIFRCILTIEHRDKKIIDYINKELFDGDSSTQIHKNPISKNATHRITLTGPILDEILPRLKESMRTKKDHIDVMIKLRESIIGVKNDPKSKKQLPPDIIEYRDELIKKMEYLNSFPFYDFPK